MTLWAVDYGVLSLTGYQTPDVLESVYVNKALQVFNADNRQRIVSRRVLTPKGATEGGGGGGDAGAGTCARTSACSRSGSARSSTDGNGRAKRRVTLPESLTTYRIMAVAADKRRASAAGDSEIRINKPLMLHAGVPALPRASATRRTSARSSPPACKRRAAAIVTIKQPRSGRARRSPARRAAAAGRRPAARSKSRFDAAAQARRPRARADARARWATRATRSKT